MIGNVIFSVPIKCTRFIPEIPAFITMPDIFSEITKIERARSTATEII